MLDKQNAAVAISLYCCYYYYCSVCLLVSYTTLYMLPQCIQLLRKRHKLECTRVYLVSSSTGLYYFVGQEGDMLVVDGLDGLLY